MSLEALIIKKVTGQDAITSDSSSDLFPREDWKYEVDNDDTNLGYEDWLTSKIEAEAFDVEYGLNRLFHAITRAPFGDMDKEACAEIVLDTYDLLRAAQDEAAAKARQVLDEEDPEFLPGNSFAVLPDDAMSDLGSIVHRGFLTYDGKVTPEEIDQKIHAFGEKYNIKLDEITLARRRQGLDLDLEP